MILQDLLNSRKSSLTETEAKLISRLVFESQQFQELATNANSHSIPLQDCWFCFVEKFKTYPKWGGEGWIPDAEDCIRSRARTSGVITEELEMEGMQLRIFDVGGQRSERRKWMHMFEHVLATIFVVGISEYDQVLFEDRGKNRLVESLELFKECCHSAWLIDANILLFLNKKDLFHKKFAIEKIPLNISGKFPSAPSDPTDENVAIEWFANQFRANKAGDQQKMFVHVTTATDPENVRTVFSACRSILLQASLVKCGL